MDKKKELMDRIEAKKREMEAKLYEAKADARAEVREKAEALQAKLDELNGYLKDGWDKVTDDIVGKLNDWLK
ncbi:MAG TPA: hypothetical protein PLZ86_05895 [bacterium]|nr:hypothetical protein [bacterium]